MIYHQQCSGRLLHIVVWAIFWLWPASSMLTVFSRIRSPFDQRHIVKYANSDPRGSGIKISFQLLDTLDDISNCSPTSLASKQNSILEDGNRQMVSLKIPDDIFWTVSSGFEERERLPNLHPCWIQNWKVPSDGMEYSCREFGKYNQSLCKCNFKFKNFNFAKLILPFSKEHQYIQVVR